MTWKKMNETEIKLAKQWYVDGVATAEIAHRLERDQSTITRLLIQRRPRKPQGRKKALTTQMMDKAVAKLDKMIEKADGEAMITVAKLKRACRLKVSERSILDALHARGIYFRPLRKKPILTEDDIIDRKAFADKYAPRSSNWWKKAIHMHIDVEHSARDGGWGAWENCVTCIRQQQRRGGGLHQLQTSHL